MHNAFVFDFDGPIFDGQQCAAKALKETFRHFETKHGTPSTDIGHLPLLEPPQLIAFVYATHGLGRNELAAIERFYRARVKENEEQAEVNLGLKVILKEMKSKSLHMAIYSGRPAGVVKNLLTRNGLCDCFEIVVGRDSAAPKPNPAGLHLIAERFQLPINNMVLIGDSDADYDAARAAKIPYYHACWTGEPTDTAHQHADALIPEIDDLWEVLESAFTPDETTRAILPEPVRKAIHASEFSFYAGAGVSVPSGIGDWTTHYVPILRKLHAVVLAGGMPFEDALELLSAEDSEGLFDAFKESFAGTLGTVNAYHNALLRSTADHIWTSNYDHLFERANQLCEFGRTVIRNDAELLSNFERSRLIVKMNGDFESPAWATDQALAPVVSRRHFDTVEYERSEIWRAFEDDYRHRCIIFVGASFTDSALRRLVSVQRGRVPRTRHHHYFLAGRSTHPLARRREYLNAKNLERLRIKTLFMDSFDEIVRFVSRMALASVNPIVTIFGSVKFNSGQDENLNLGSYLENGSMNLGAIETFCKELGRELASTRSYRVTSGGAPGVGIPFVQSAFEVEPTLARCYLRKSSKQISRRVPVQIVSGEDYSSMRKFLIGEAHIAIALGGEPRSNSGVIEEIDLALNRQIPVLLVPQAGGAVYELAKTFSTKIVVCYRDDSFRSVLKRANEEIASVPAANLNAFARSRFPQLIEEVLLVHVGSNSLYYPPSRW